MWLATYLPTKNAVPTQDMVSDALRSLAMTGVAVDTAVWSIKATMSAKPGTLLACGTAQIDSHY